MEQGTVKWYVTLLVAIVLMVAGTRGVTVADTPRAKTTTRQTRASTRVRVASQGDGTFTTFDIPGSTFTNPASINPAGLIAGWYWDANSVSHGFLREPNGTITTFDVPGATQTSLSAINSAGLITGTYSDANFVQHGFLARP